MCHYLLRQNSKSFKVLHQKKSLGTPDINHGELIKHRNIYLYINEVINITGVIFRRYICPDGPSKRTKKETHWGPGL